MVRDFALVRESALSCCYYSCCADSYFFQVNHHAHERRNFVENCLEFIAQFLSTTKNEVGKVLIARPLFRTREILFDGSSAIPAAAIEIDVERLRKRAQPSPIAVRRITLDKFSRGW